MYRYEKNIKKSMNLTFSIINKTNRAKALLESVRDSMRGDDVLLIKTITTKIDFRGLVDFLFNLGLDVFDIEFGSVTKIYVCLIDSYRIQNSVVFSLRNQV